MEFNKQERDLLSKVFYTAVVHLMHQKDYINGGYTRDHIRDLYNKITGDDLREEVNEISKIFDKK